MPTNDEIAAQVIIAMKAHIDAAMVERENALVGTLAILQGQIDDLSALVTELAAKAK